ncbi:MAG TPA: hypothetical protein VMB21_19115 [Candidatus Limnocylindria bacterium]|nr:hypothetical protein [Candidatus Limnocylindria bacterium]
MNVLKAHFRAKDQNEPNALGGERTHFWRAVMGTVQSPVVAANGRRVSVSINHPAIAQKVKGGRIVAKRGAALTIPIVPEAHGRTAATFERETGRKLFIVRIGNTKDNPFADAVLAAATGGGIQVEYLLRREVNQRPDPTALPPQAVLEDTLFARAEKWAARQAAIAQGNNPATNEGTDL